MKILIASTLRRKVTTEEPASRSNIIFNLASGLTAKGHEVTLVGTGDSTIQGVKIVPIIPQGLVDLPPAENAIFREFAMMAQLSKKIEELQRTGNFDIIHNHSVPDFMLSLIEENLQIPMVTTVHIQPTEYVDDTLALFPKTKFVCISKAQQSLLTKSKVEEVIYNGVDTNIYTYNEKKDDYLLWLGRLSRAKNADGSFMDPKGVRWAIQLAKETNQRLILSGNVEDKSFFETEVKPHLNDKIQWVGEISEKVPLTKQAVAGLMQKAKAFLMTINWYEPFGLVMAESMSCGTPVIAFDRGSVKELIQDGVTGFIVNPEEGIEGLKKAVGKVDTIKPIDCRNHVEKNFSVGTMVTNYESLYKRLTSR